MDNTCTGPYMHRTIHVQENILVQDHTCTGKHPCIVYSFISCVMPGKYINDVDQKHC